MISKREYFEICPGATEETWNTFRKEMARIEEKIWEEDHPLDD